jgi:hypothetical protein
LGSWLEERDINGGEFGLGVCPVFGCIEASVDWHDEDGFGVNFRGGVGVAVAMPGVGANLISDHSSGWTEYNSLFGSTPVPGGEGAWVFDEKIQEGEVQWTGATANSSPGPVEASDAGGSRASRYSWGGGYVHTWEWGSD